MICVGRLRPPLAEERRYLLELFCDRRLATGNDILRLVIREYMYLTLNKQQNTAMTNYRNGPQRTATDQTGVGVIFSVGAH